MTDLRSNLGLTPILSATEQIRSSLGMSQISGSHLGSAIDQLRSPFGAMQMISASEQIRSSLGMSHMTGPFLGSAAEQIRSSLGMAHVASTSLGKNPLGAIAEQMRSVLDVTQLGSTLEQARVNVGQIGSMASYIVSMKTTANLRDSTGFFASMANASLIGSAFGQYRTILVNSSIQSVIDELKVRNADTLAETTTENVDALVKQDLDGYGPQAKTGYIAEPISSENTDAHLSGIPTTILSLWLFIFCHICLVLANYDAIRLAVVDINARIPQTDSFSEIRNFIRKELAGKPGDVRLVTGSNVRLRANSNMKSKVIIDLKNNAVVVVIGKEDRNWLLVSYEHEGYLLEGYVSTKFLRKI